MERQSTVLESSGRSSLPHAEMGGDVVDGTTALPSAQERATKLKEAAACDRISYTADRMRTIVKQKSKIRCYAIGGARTASCERGPSEILEPSRSTR